MKKKKYPSHLIHGHSEKEIQSRLEANKTQSYLRDVIYGSIDGTVTTFAVVSGVIGAELPTQTILILGFANLFADGFSMGASNYLGTKTEIQEQDLIARFEREQVESDPEGEKQEVRQILKAKGFEGELLEKATDLFTEEKERWVDFMLKEEYDLSLENKSAFAAGATTFVAFFVFGLVPLLPFLIGLSSAYIWACGLTATSFFLTGSLKSRWTAEHFATSGLKTLAIGVIAAALAFSVGTFLKGIV